MAHLSKRNCASALALNSEDETRQAYLTYQKNVNEFARRAQSRLELQSELLSHAARWNLAEQVATEIMKVAEEDGGDSYFETELPWVVLSELAEKAPEQTTAINAKLKAKRRAKPKGLALLENSARSMNDLDIPKVVQLLGRGTPALPDSQRRRWLLRLATQQVLKGKAEPMLSFLLGLFNVDPFLGEDAAELIVALATRQDQGKLIWTELEQRSWATTQKLAGYRGFIAAVDPAKEQAKN